MPKDAGAALKSAFAAETSRLRTLAKLKTNGGTILGFTDNEADISLDLGDGDGTVVYQAAVGWFRSAFRNTGDLAPGDIEFRGPLVSGGIEAAEVRKGTYDYAELQLYTVDSTTLGSGAQYEFRGVLGEVTLWDYEFAAEVRDLSGRLDTAILRTVTPTCDADLGDSRCGVTIEPADWQAATAYALGDLVKATTEDGRRYVCTVAGTSGAAEPSWDTGIGNTTADNTVEWTTADAFKKSGTVSSVTSKAEFDSDLTDAAEKWDRGRVIWRTGDNAGLSREIKTYSTGGGIKCYLDLPSTIQIGDTFEVEIGCDQTPETCKNTFANIENFRGFPFVPGDGVLKRSPDAR